MISLSRTFFSLGLLASVLCAGEVRGRVELRDSKDPAVRKRSDFSGVVVWLEPGGGQPASAPASGRARMVQQNKVFTPHVLAIQTGTTVDFPNYDPIFHNAFSNYDGQVFDVGLYPPGSSRAVRFRRPGVVRVFCNIHANMSAVIVVLATPHFATTAANGEFAMAGIPAGEYTLRVFHERATPATLKALERRVAVGGDNISLPVITVSENGYLSIPHANKFGKDYGSAPDEGGAYPVTRK